MDFPSGVTAYASPRGLSYRTSPRRASRAPSPRGGRAGGAVSYTVVDEGESFYDGNPRRRARPAKNTIYRDRGQPARRRGVPRHEPAPVVVMRSPSPRRRVLSPRRAVRSPTHQHPTYSSSRKAASTMPASLRIAGLRGFGAKANGNYYCRQALDKKTAAHVDGPSIIYAKSDNSGAEQLVYERRTWAIVSSPTSKGSLAFAEVEQLMSPCNVPMREWKMSNGTEDWVQASPDFAVEESSVVGIVDPLVVTDRANTSSWMVADNDRSRQVYYEDAVPYRTDHDRSRSVYYEDEVSYRTDHDRSRPVYYEDEVPYVRSDVRRREAWGSSPSPVRYYYDEDVLLDAFTPQASRVVQRR